MGELTYAEGFVRAVAPWLVHIAEACSVLVVLYGIVRAFLAFVSSAIRVRGGNGPPTNVRLNLGRALALALEFLLAADILETAVAPSTNAVIQLGNVAVIRTGLNYFLSKELEQESKEVGETVATGANEAIRGTVQV